MKGYKLKYPKKYITNYLLQVIFQGLHYIYLQTNIIIGRFDPIKK